jgi:hypothetical protein
MLLVTTVQLLRPLVDMLVTLVLQFLTLQHQILEPQMVTLQKVNLFCIILYNIDSLNK